MEFPEKYIKRGDFTLHAGNNTSIFYDVNHMLTDEIWFPKILRSIPNGFAYAGIATAGAIIASHLLPYAIVKDGELKGIIDRKYCLIDDVCTTEKSLRDAIKIIGKDPNYIFCVVDRRKPNIKTLEIHSMFQV